MSKFTTEVRWVCEMAYESIAPSEGVKPTQIIRAIHNKIFDFDYPIFDDSYKAVLEEKILKHYYTREICEETVGLWKLRLEDKLNIIMPYYNQLYESAKLEFNPLRNHDITTEHDGSNSDEYTNQSASTSSNTSANTNYNLFSDTPQGGLDGLDGIENPSSSTDTKGYYLTNATKDYGNGTNSGQGSTNGSGSSSAMDEYVNHTYGLIGTNASRLLQDFRNTFLNIDEMIIKDLEPLFMQLW